MGYPFKFAYDIIWAMCLIWVNVLQFCYNFQGDYGEAGPPGRQELRVINKVNTTEIDELRDQFKGYKGVEGPVGVKGIVGPPGADSDAPGAVVSIIDLNLNLFHKLCMVLQYVES